MIQLETITQWQQWWFCAVLDSVAALPLSCTTRAVSYRERSSAAYNSLVYSRPLGLIELPYTFFGVCLFLIPFSFLVGFCNGGEWFFRSLLFQCLVSYCFSGFDQSLAGLTLHAIVANIFQGLRITFCSVGFIFCPHIIPVGWKWLYYSLPSGKGLFCISNSTIRLSYLSVSNNSRKRWSRYFIYYFDSKVCWNV